MNLRAAAVVALLCSLGWSAPARAQCGGTQLCAPGAGDCTVAANCTITLPVGGLVIDLGARRLVITRTLTVAGPAGAALVVNVGNLLLDGGTIVAPGAGDIAGSVAINSASDVTVQNNALIDVSGALSAGVVDLEALGGNLLFSGRIKANGTTRGAFGGDATLFAAGSANVGGSSIDVSGGDQGAGGSIFMDTQTGSLSLTLPLNAAGGDGGDILLSAGTILQTSSAATMRVGASGDAGSGGGIDLDAVNDITVGGEWTGNGSPAISSEDGQSGGDGADVSVLSDTGNVTINGRIEVIGAAAGAGGTIDLAAGQNLTVSRPMVASATGDGASGGDVLLLADGMLSMPQQVDVRGGTGSGGTIDATAGTALTVSASLLTDGSQLGGTVLLAGCTVNVTSQALLSAQGPGGGSAGANFVRASSAMTVAGTLRATSQNLLAYRAAPAPILTGASIQPAATIQLEPTLPCCVSCPTTTTTTTTTSTSIIGTTTTSTTTTTTSPPSICGDGVVSGAEQCDDHNLAPGDCCSPLCRYEAAGSTCASDANACTADVCNATGVCTHPAGNAGSVCRAAAGPCDQAETCSGTSPTCPADAKSTAVCRPAAGVCDQAESCNGVSDTCPPDAAAPAGTGCRAAAGICDAAETCDGASKTCPADAKRTAVCRPSTGPCDLDDRCDGAGDACPADAKAPDGTACGAANACSAGAACSAGTCEGGTQTGCPPCETCDSGTGTCVAGPRVGCGLPVQSGRARLVMKRSLRGPASDLVVWKWVNGAATTTSEFGNPLATDDITFCVYDRSQATPSLLFRAELPAASTCGTKPCWTAGGGKGFKFTSKGGNASGITSAKLASGDAGRAKILLKGKGVNLTGRPFGLPHPSLPVPLTAQLQSDTGACWEASYSRPGLRRNDGQEFNGIAD